MRWQHWHYRFSFKTKILALVLSVSFVSIVLMAAFTSYYYTVSAKKDFYMIAEDSTARINHQLDRYFNQMAQSTYASIAGPLPTNPLLGSNPESGLLQKWLNSGEQFSQTQISLVEGILTKYIALNDSNILGIVLRALDDRLAYSQDSNLPQSKEAPWIDTPVLERLRVVPYYYNRSSTTATAYPFITLIIPVFNPSTVKIVGNLNVALSISEISNILGQARLGKTGYFFIVDSAGKIIYHPDVQWVGEYLENTALHEIRLSEKYDEVRQDGKKILVSNNHSELTGWNIVAYVPMNEMANGLNVARNSTLMIMTGIIIISLLLTPRVVGLVVHPIRRLSLLMKRVENGDLSVSAEVIPGKDEIQQLNSSFNRMKERLSELIHNIHDLEMKEAYLQLRQRDALIQALQNQINPHLLYNTLEIIKSIAYLEKVPMIEKMATNLASVYRYTSKMPGLEVPLRDELRNLQHYLEIVYIRFGPKFQSRIIVDEKYMDCQIVKLSIQPIAENSVKYAVEPKNGNAVIQIHVFEEQDDLMIELSDNGNGFSEEVLQRIRMSIQAMEGQSGQAAAEESVGIINVHARMVLNYGAPYGVTIRSTQGTGSVVTLRFPKRIKTEPSNRIKSP
ncbi:two-component system, sensor histidine kinase YesM [Paenibacillus sp. UNCCL117]|uniref:sensor histidine kinase n=1 Tax=unclassified Paenibacillus TaxID=185978 RepID=UPI00088C37D9|nr:MULTISPECIES: sensor histidine kinase [unclassified Paenibacillus]SDD40940.1 two-component system, sensor histidine kinase YesM [Paenibacillus sp. cl123]SFW47972.1 two-component system, sensor histidine kinase YesM [Paenibacillus sp. UNCCL117]